MKRLLAVLLALAGVGALAVTDDRGAEVRLRAPPQRVVSLLPSVTESICELGACGRLVGVDDFSNWPAQVKRLPHVGGLADASLERIVALKPDLVILDANARALPRLQALGIPVAGFEIKTLKDMDNVLHRLGELLAVPGADAVRKRIDAGIDSAARSLPPQARGLTVYFEVDDGPYAAGESSHIGELLMRLGAANIVPASLGSVPKLNPEFVVRADPQVIMIGAARLVAHPRRARRPCLRVRACASGRDRASGPAAGRSGAVAGRLPGRPPEGSGAVTTGLAASRAPSRRPAPTVLLAVALAVAGVALVLLGTAVGSLGWEPFWTAADARSTILWDIRLPRSTGAWLAGALLGLAGAIAQGLFRNPLADPYLMGSATGAAFGVAVLLVLAGSMPGAIEGGFAQAGLTVAAFLGAVAAVFVTLALARGVQHTLRLLLAGVIVGVVFGALASLVMFWAPEVMRAMQVFLLGTTSFLGWPASGMLAAVLVLVLVPSVALSPALDALSLGEATAASLGVPLRAVRVALVAAMALATGAAVAQVGLIAFLGLVAPHVVRAAVRPAHRWLLPLSALAGGALLLAADILSRWLFAPQELPVGVLTALLGGAYLLWLMHRRPL